MKKSKIETFLKENNLTMEVTTNGVESAVFIYKKDDLYLFKFRSESMNDAIDIAVHNYLSKEG